MTNRYIGVEQEFISFSQEEKPRQLPFEWFKQIKSNEPNYYEKGNTAIRTTTGHAIYKDGNEIEVCTPPVRLNKGFATRLSDLIMIGREKIVRAVPLQHHTGYSMHWNNSWGDTPHDEACSSNGNTGRFYRGFAIPFNLFGITPVSTGFNMRAKDDNGSGLRMEFLGDYLSGEQQINALALLFGAYSYAFDSASGVVPIYPCNPLERKFEPGQQRKNMLENGRYSQLTIAMPEEGAPKNFRIMQAQKYIELFYQWLAPAVRLLGTKQEIDNLESFVFGNQPLEFDRFKFFANLLDNNGKTNGIYMPRPVLDKAMPNKTVILSTDTPRPIPLEGRLMGGIIANHKKLGIRHIGWGQIHAISGLDKQEINGIDEVYEYCAARSEVEQTLERSPGIQDLASPCRLDTSSLKRHRQIGPRNYDKNKDSYVEFIEPSLSEKILKTVSDEIKRSAASWIKSFVIGGSIGLLAPILFTGIRTRDQTVKTRNHYIDAFRTNNVSVVCQSTNNIPNLEAIDRR